MNDLTAAWPPVDYDEPRRRAGELAWRGLQWLAPNLTDPSLYSPLPPPPPMPETPRKVPSADHDPRILRGLWDVANIGMLLAPIGPAPAAIRFAPRVARAAGASNDALRFMTHNELGIFPTPSRAPRPFELDYPPARWPSVPTNSRGGLLKGIDKEDLYGAHIVGRRVKDGPDEPLSVAELVDVLDRTGARLHIVGPNHSALKGVKDGAYEFDTAKIFVNNALAGPDRYRVIAHELLHHFENRAGKIPMTRNMRKELEPIYSAQATGREDLSGKQLFLPKDAGYSYWKRPGELKGEGFRALVENPNFFKTVAPESTEAFRAALKASKEFAPNIQVNSFILPALGGAAAASLPPPAAVPPFFPERAGM